MEEVEDNLAAAKVRSMRMRKSKAKMEDQTWTTEMTG